MNGLFAPAVVLLNRLRYPWKFALIGLLFTVPLAMVVFFLVVEVRRGIDFAEKEALGNEYLRPLRTLLEDLQTRRGLTFALVRHRAIDQDLQRLEVEIDEDIRAVDAVDRRLGATLGATQEWTTIKGQARRLIGRGATTPATEFPSTRRSSPTCSPSWRRWATSRTSSSIRTSTATT